MSECPEQLYEPESYRYKKLQLKDNHQVIKSLQKNQHLSSSSYLNIYVNDLAHEFIFITIIFMQQAQGKQFKTQIILVGNARVGKTSLADRYFHNGLSQMYQPTIGVNFYQQNIVSKNTPIRLCMWDTGGKRVIHQIFIHYLQRSSGVIIVCDITNKSSLESINYCNDFINSHNPSAIKMLVCNKSDEQQKREIQFQTLMNLATELEMECFQVSAKDAVNVQKIFHTLLFRIMERQKEIAINNN